MTYYVSESDKVSTISNNFYQKHKLIWEYLDHKKMQMETCTLTDILQSYLPKNPKIDLLSIDVEGSDYDVLRGLDLQIYQPRIILVEDHTFDLTSMDSNQICKYLTNAGYMFKYYFVYNCIYVRNS